MKSNNMLLMITVILFGVSACVSNTPITSNYEKNRDFSSYKNYKLLKHEDDFAYGVYPKHQQYIEKAIQREMMVIGYSLSQKPDLLVAYFVKEKLVQEADYNYQGYYRKWGFPLWKNVVEYKEGTLIVDIIDNNNQQVIWHGAFNRKISEDTNDVEENINKIVQRLFEQFNKETRKDQ